MTILKVVEENVEQLKAESVEHTADQRRIGIPDKTPDIGVGSQRSDAVLHAEQNRHGECDPAPGQDDREPEKRTAQKIKGI